MYKSIMKAYLFIFFALLLSYINAQHDNDNWIKDYHLYRTGMPSNVIYSIGNDSEDSHWICTDGGLAKFGYDRSWKVYKNSNSGLPNNSVRGVIIDSEDNKWVLTIGAKIAKLDTMDNWTVFNPALNIPANEYVNSFFRDKSGNFWIGTTNFGLLRLNVTEDEWTSFNTENGLPTNDIRSFNIDSLDSKWIGTNNGGLVKLNSENEIDTIINFSGLRNIIKSIAIDNENTKWIGTADTGIVKISSDLKKIDIIKKDTTFSVCDINYISIDPNNNKWIGTAGNSLIIYDNKEIFKQFKGFPSNFIGYITPDAWVGTDNGLVKIDSLVKNKAFLTTYDTDNSNVSIDDHATSIMQDMDDNIWIGTSKSGLVKLNVIDSSWVFYNTDFSLIPSNVIFDIEVDKNNVRWIGTSKGLVKYDGVTFDDPKNWTIYNNSNSLIINNNVNTITIDKSGNKWLGTNGGLSKFDGKYFTNYTTSNSFLPHNVIKSIGIDETNTLWIGTNGGVAKFDGSDEWEVFTTNNSQIPSNKIVSVVIDKNKNKLFGSSDKGFSVYDTNYTFTTYNVSKSDIPSNKINFISIDSLSIWIGTSDSGLVRYVKSANWWTVYKTENSKIPNNEILSFHIDKNDNKWIGTEGGRVVVFKESDEILSVGNETNNSILLDYKLYQNYPNPFNPTTTISYSLPYNSAVKVTIYDIMGREINSFENSSQSNGTHAIVWNGTDKNGSNVASGVYLYKLSIKSLENSVVFEKSSKMLLLK